MAFAGIWSGLESYRQEDARSSRPQENFRRISKRNRCSGALLRLLTVKVAGDAYFMFMVTVQLRFAAYSAPSVRSCSCKTSTTTTTSSGATVANGACLQVQNRGDRIGRMLHLSTHTYRYPTLVTCNIPAAFYRLLNVLKAENDRDLYLVSAVVLQCQRLTLSAFAQMQFGSPKYLSAACAHARTTEPRSAATRPETMALTQVFEYMETDLHAVIRANILEEVHKQYIMYQLFKALKYMHSGELLHRDIKVQMPSTAVNVCSATYRTRWRCCFEVSSVIGPQKAPCADPTVQGALPLLSNPAPVVHLQLPRSPATCC